MLKINNRHQALSLRLIGVLILACTTVSALAQESPDLSGIWMMDREKSGRFPSVPPYTLAGQEAVNNFNEKYPAKTYDPGSFCVFQGMPSTMFGGSYWVEFIQRPERTTIVFELSKPVRRIYTDGRPHPEDPFPQKNGHSIGHWEGNTLVVDTMGIEAREGRVPSSNALRIVERISIGADESLIEEITVNDPMIFTEPVVITQYYTRFPDDQLIDYECTDGPWRDYLREYNKQ
jgi:hypothetical protein